MAPLNQFAERFSSAIEHSTAVDPLADVLSSVWKRLLPQHGPVRDALSGTPTGHPAHPFLVLLPLGSWISSAALDLVGGVGSRAAATRLLAVGNVAALPAVLAGANDWMDTSGQTRRVGAVHALLNTVGVSLFTASWVARRSGRHRAGVGLSLTGLAVSSTAGWLGGHLSYARGVGVDTTIFQQLPEDWTDVGRLDQVQEGRPLLVRAHGLPVLLVRDEGQVRALADRCTHRGGPLHQGPVEGGCVTCPWHGSVFRLRDGQVLAGPASRPQPCLEVRVVDERVEVRAPAGAFESGAIS